MGSALSFVLAIIRGRAGVRLHQRLPRQRQLHRHRGRRPGCSRPAWRWSGPPFFNFVAAFVVGTAVAKTIGKGLIDPAVVDPDVILAALLGAIVWNLITWWLGLPQLVARADGRLWRRGGGEGGRRRADPRRLDQADPLHLPLAHDRAGRWRSALTVALSWLLRTAHVPGRWTGSSAGCSSSRRPSTPSATAPTTRRRRWASSSGCSWLIPGALRRPDRLDVASLSARRGQDPALGGDDGLHRDLAWARRWAGGAS